MNVFLMVKSSWYSAYLFINDCCYLLYTDGVNIPSKIDHINDSQLIPVDIHSSLEMFAANLEKFGYTKHPIEVDTGFTLFKCGVNKEAITSVEPSKTKTTCQAFGGKTGSNPIPVEDVPIGAHITGIENDDGEIDEFSFPVQRIEVSDGFITFLHYWPSKQRTYSYEVSIKRGTRVTYTIK